MNREPWEMTEKEWASLSNTQQAETPGLPTGAPLSASNYHFIQVIQALREGLPVPERVIESFGPITVPDYAKGTNLGGTARGVLEMERRDFLVFHPAEKRLTRLSIRSSKYHDKDGFHVYGTIRGTPRQSLFFEKRSEAEEFVRRVKDGESSDAALREIWSTTEPARAVDAGAVDMSKLAGRWSMRAIERRDKYGSPIIGPAMGTLYSSRLQLEFTGKGVIPKLDTAYLESLGLKRAGRTWTGSEVVVVHHETSPVARTKYQVGSQVRIKRVGGGTESSLGTTRR